MQIQYPSLTLPPPATPPTTDRMGWRPSVPDNVQLTPRGRYGPNRLQTASQTTGATVFAIEQWALPKPLIAKAYLPDNPQQFQRRQDYRTRGGGYLNTTWTAYDSDPEDWALPKPMVATAFVPDTLVYRRKFFYGPPFTTDISLPAAAQTGTDWMTAWPDARRPFRLRQPIMGDVDPLSPEGFPATLGWGTETPDNPQQFIARRLWAASMPALFKGEAIENFAPTLQWDFLGPDTTTRAKLGTANLPAFISDPTTPPPAQTGTDWMSARPDVPTGRARRLWSMPALFRGETIESAPPKLLWSVQAPDTTRRAVLAVAERPAAFFTLGLEQRAPTLQWSVQAPSTTRRAVLSSAAMPSVAARPDPVLATQVTFWAVAPSTTRRASLPVSLQPSVTVRAEPIVQPATQITYWVVAPVATRRRALPVADMPSSFRSTFLVHLIVDRRHDDQPDRVGSRAATTRIEGF